MKPLPTQPAWPLLTGRLIRERELSCRVRTESSRELALISGKKPIFSGIWPLPEQSEYFNKIEKKGFTEPKSFASLSTVHFLLLA